MSSSVTSLCEPNGVFQKIAILNERNAVGNESIPIKFTKITAEYIASLFNTLPLYK